MKNIHGYYLNIDSFGDEEKFKNGFKVSLLPFRNSQFVNKIITPVQYEEILEILKEKNNGI